MVVIPVGQFEQMVADALDDLPPDLGAAMENVAVVVDDQSPPGRLAGLYQGVPLTGRGSSLGHRLGSHHHLHGHRSSAACETPEQVAELVRKVVIHEVGHHFGIDDKRLEELGWG